MANRDYGILCCINCIGMNPDEPVTMMEAALRINNPQKLVMKKWQDYSKKTDLYKNKSCMLCGRTYDHNGILDESYELTAKRVKLEFENAGIHGVADDDIKKVVASCIKSWKLLWKNRATIAPQEMEKMTFAGRLALIITHAQEAREKRDSLGGGKPLGGKGMLIK